MIVYKKADGIQLDKIQIVIQHTNVQTSRLGGRHRIRNTPPS